MINGQWIEERKKENFNASDILSTVCKKKNFYLQFHKKIEENFQCGQMEDEDNWIKSN